VRGWGAVIIIIIIIAISVDPPPTIVASARTSRKGISETRS
jgi:hypothetical protein